MNKKGGQASNLHVISLPIQISHKVPDEFLGVFVKAIVLGVMVVLCSGCPLHQGLQFWSFLCQWLCRCCFRQSQSFGPLVSSWKCAGWNLCNTTGQVWSFGYGSGVCCEIRVCYEEWCPNGCETRGAQNASSQAKLGTGDLIWICDAGLHPLSLGGVAPYSRDSSRDLLTSSSWEVLWCL